MGGITLEQARTAKAKVAEALNGVPEVNGVGISKVDEDYAVRVNLREAADSAALPATMDGVRVQYEVVGEIRKRLPPL